MEANLLEPPQTSPKKRSYDGEIIQNPSVISITTTNGPASLVLDQNIRQQSPTLSTTSSSLTDLTPSVGQAHSTSTPSGSETKKRKLTFAEREVEKAVKKAEKEAKEKQRAEEKARKDEEKRVKDEEKSVKEEEKEAARRERELEKERKRQAKEAEKKAKDDEKAKKEEEKRKKEKSQMRLGAFFGRPAPASTPPTTPDDLSSAQSSRRSSIAEVDLEQPLFHSRLSPTKNSDYEKLFPSFFVFNNMELAPANRFLKSQHVELGLPNGVLEQNSEEVDSRTLRRQFQRCSSIKRRKSHQQRPSVRQLIDRINGTSAAPTDLTFENKDTQPLRTLEKVPFKYLAFKHLDFDLNTRPPYEGTYSRVISARSIAKLCKNPMHRGLPDTDYDYDSEVEWEPPQEGDEDINLEDDESDEEGDEEEMDDFLDDDGDVNRRRNVVSETDAVSSGLCWEGEACTSNPFNMNDFKIDVLDDSHRFPIDPFSNVYWKKPGKEPATKAKKEPDTATGLMQPPRMPLSSVSAPNMLALPASQAALKLGPLQLDVENVAPSTKTKAKINPNRPLKLVPDDLLSAFTQAVSGSDLTKAGLIEVLKKQFPKVSKDSIKDTLSAVAVREGVKEVDKRWVLIPQ